MARDPKRRHMVFEAIQKAGLTSLACFSSTEVLMLTGYWPVMGASLAIATAAGTIVGIAPEDELEIAHATSDIEFIPYHPASLEKLSDLSEALSEPIRQLFSRLEMRNGKMGADLSAGVQAVSYQSVSHFRSSIVPLLHQAQLDIQVVPCARVFDQLMSKLSDVELSLLRKASIGAGLAFKEAASAIAEGRSENEIASDAEHAFNRRGGEGFERSKGYFFCMSGPNSYKAAGAYARTRKRVLEEGDFVMVHANTTGDGYWTDITRTYVVGQPSDLQQEMYEAVFEAREAALSAVKPGAKASKVDDAARSVLAKRGFGNAFKHAVGHGVGFSAADDHARPRLHPHSPDVLEAGMTFNIEPAIYLENIGGLRHCDVVACTANGAEVLTDF